MSAVMFQRARREEQREARRQAILRAPAAPRSKGATIAGPSAPGALLLRAVPELGEPDAFRLAGAAVMTTAALWPHPQPSAAMLAAYTADPALAALRLDFTATLREVLEV